MEFSITIYLPHSWTHLVFILFKVSFTTATRFFALPLTNISVESNMTTVPNICNAQPTSRRDYHTTCCKTP
jgi:hypothetical protein